MYNIFWEGMFYFAEHTEIFGTEKELTLKDYHENIASGIAYFFLVFIIAYGLIRNFIKNSEEQAELINQKSNAEVQALKAQINPHFLFNVLNNLYGTAIVEESPKTAEGIQQLSSIMRHVVEGTKNERISAEKEVQFLYDFVELNKMRIPKRDNIKIRIDIDFDEAPTQIAPLLVIPYIENAFKYGISITQESFIDLKFIIKDQKLSFSCRNSIIKQFDKLEVGTSTGIENTQRRLSLNYPHKHSLKISNENNIFEVALEVNLK
ncbi:MAG: histidine kinase [Emticicia sp.]|nr:histidine kinase [Emticicia sp.]